MIQHTRWVHGLTTPSILLPNPSLLAVTSNSGFVLVFDAVKFTSLAKLRNPASTSPAEDTDAAAAAASDGDVPFPPPWWGKLDEAASAGERADADCEDPSTADEPLADEVRIKSEIETAGLGEEDGPGESESEGSTYAVWLPWGATDSAGRGTPYYLFVCGQVCCTAVWQVDVTAPGVKDTAALSATCSIVANLGNQKFHYPRLHPSGSFMAVAEDSSGRIYVLDLRSLRSQLGKQTTPGVPLEATAAAVSISQSVPWLYNTTVWPTSSSMIIGACAYTMNTLAQIHTSFGGPDTDLPTQDDAAQGAEAGALVGKIAQTPS